MADAAQIAQTSSWAIGTDVSAASGICSVPQGAQRLRNAYRFVTEAVINARMTEPPSQRLVRPTPRRPYYQSVPPCLPPTGYTESVSVGGGPRRQDAVADAGVGDKEQCGTMPHFIVMLGIRHIYTKIKN